MWLLDVLKCYLKTEQHNYLKLLLTKSLYYNNMFLEKADCSAFLAALQNQYIGFDCMYLLPLI